MPRRVVHAKVRIPEPSDRKQLEKRQKSDVEQSKKTKRNGSRQRFKPQRNVRQRGGIERSKAESVF